MTAPGAPAGFRVATFNVENLGAAEAEGTANPEDRLRLLRPQLLRLRADVLCLQEVDSQKPAGGGERRLSALDDLLAGTPYAGWERVCTRSRSSGRIRDKHNLVVVSRLPIVASRQVLHDRVAPPLHRPVTGAGAGAGMPVEWDRPILHVTLELGDGRRLHVVNVHLRAPRAAWLDGEKIDSHTWRSMSGWAEGFFLAAVKRAGQALEVRLVVEELFDADADALVVVCGDFNADSHEVPVRTIRGDEEDAGNPLLASRTLVPVERALADSRHFSVVHHGRPQMLDHLLVSRPLLAWFRSVEVHNEALGDELLAVRMPRGSAESSHAPVVAEFRSPDAAEAGADRG